MPPLNLDDSLLDRGDKMRGPSCAGYKVEDGLPLCPFLFMIRLSNIRISLCILVLTILTAISLHPFNHNRLLPYHRSLILFLSFISRIQPLCVSYGLATGINTIAAISKVSSVDWFGSFSYNHGQGSLPVTLLLSNAQFISCSLLFNFRN